MRIGLLALASFLALGCGGDDSNGPPEAAPPDVSIRAGADTLGTDAYLPNSLTISLAAQQSVKWRNADNIDHTATQDGGGFDSGALGAAGTFTHTFDTPGIYAYHCTIHPSMVGTITVTP